MSLFRPTFTKDPNSTLDWQVDWSLWMSPTDQISTSTWTLDPLGNLTVSSNTKDTTTTTVWLAGGTDGTVVSVTNRITTTGGRTADQTFDVRVEQQ